MKVIIDGIPTIDQYQRAPRTWAQGPRFAAEPKRERSGGEARGSSEVKTNPCLSLGTEGWKMVLPNKRYLAWETHCGFLEGSYRLKPQESQKHCNATSHADQSSIHSFLIVPFQATATIVVQIHIFVRPPLFFLCGFFCFFDM